MGSLHPPPGKKLSSLSANVSGRFATTRAGQAIGVVGSTRTTNEENYLLQKFARTVLGTNNIDHHRTADFPAFAAALTGKPEATASMRDVFNAPAILLIGNNPTEQHPLLAWQIRNNVRLHRARLYVINSQPIKLRRQATSFVQIPAGTEGKLAAFLAGDDAVRRRNRQRQDSRGMDGLPCATSCAASKIWSSFSDRRFAAEISLRWCSSVRAFQARSSRALPTTPIRAGLPTWDFIPICCPATSPSRTTGLFHEEWGGVPSTPGLTLPQMVESAKDRPAEGALRRGRESGRAIRHRSLRLFARLRSCAGYVPDGDGGHR